MEKVKTKHPFLIGVSDALPVALGLWPIGITLGVAAGSLGFLLRDMSAMSAIVYAGSAQFIGVDMLEKGATAATIITATFFINFRHFMMSSAYAPYLHGKSVWALLIVSFGITDETFAVGITRAKADPNGFGIAYLFGLEFTAWFSWLCATVLGILLGGFIPNFEKFGLSFALPAMFIGLIAMLAKTKTHLLVCLASGVLSLFLYLIGITNFNVIIAALVVSFAAVGVKYAIKR
ncbi:MAG: AzlC family ABC transporter permease [Eubacteriales bacterium]